MNKVTKKEVKFESISVKVIITNELGLKGEYPLKIEFINVEPEPEEENVD